MIDVPVAFAVAATIQPQLRRMMAGRCANSPDSNGLSKQQDTQSMPRFNITLSQQLDDGDCALVEEHTNVDGYYVADIISEYHRRAVAHSYVESYTVVVTIKH